MRVKSELRRQAIVRVAELVFQELGFEGASMDAIAQRVGGSKATLYSYFPSKEELFVEVMLTAAERQQELCFGWQASETDVEKTLTDIGVKYLGIITRPEVVAVRRMIHGMSGQSDIGKTTYARGAQKAWQDVTRYLTYAMDKGFLKVGDSALLTRQLRALYDAEVGDLQLLGVVATVTQEEIERMAATAVKTFLCVYKKTAG